MNNPTVTNDISPEHLKAYWGEIRNIVNNTLPQNEELLRLMKAAGAPTTIEEISVSKNLCETGLKYHSFMRHRLTLMRLRPMLGI
jgi:glycerol dehydrogenase-like iron-containing ADH family enzyme